MAHHDITAKIFLLHYANVFVYVVLYIVRDEVNNPSVFTRSRKIYKKIKHNGISFSTLSDSLINLNFLLSLSHYITCFLFSRNIYTIYIYIYMSLCVRCFCGLISHELGHQTPHVAPQAPWEGNSSTAADNVYPWGYLCYTSITLMFHNAISFKKDDRSLSRYVLIFNEHLMIYQCELQITASSNWFIISCIW